MSSPGLFLLCFFLLFPSFRVLAQSCLQGIYCIHALEEAGAVHFYVESSLPGPVSILFDVSAQNLRSDQTIPFSATFQPGHRAYAFTMQVVDSSQPWNYQYNTRWQYGDLSARHTRQYNYALPYAIGDSFEVIQTAYGAFSHQNKYAIDWRMPEGTPIHAAREGIVLAYQDANTMGGIGDEFREKANFIVIAHPDGTLGHYVHLQHRGVVVRTGQYVRRGQLIAYSGNTGYSSAPHLHFEVFQPDTSMNRRTIPLRFSVGEKKEVRLEQGKSYRRH